MIQNRATIIGSGAITKTAPYIFEHSFGLNYAAIKYKTKYAVAGHDVVINLYRENKISFIGVLPTFDLAIFPIACIDYIKNDTTASRNNDWTDDDVRFYIKAATQNKDIGYPNMLTILHLAIYFCIKNKYTIIDLFGCQNNYDEVETSHAYDKEAAPLMRKYTDAMVRIAPEFGILINWHK